MRRDGCPVGLLVPDDADIVFTATPPVPITGAPGATGGTGPAGATGYTGVEGPAGWTGATGPMGATGTMGQVGTPGATGPQGIAGVTGDLGSTGATGPKGSKGEKGEHGIRGPAGQPGKIIKDDGSNVIPIGSSVYEESFLASDTFSLILIVWLVIITLLLIIIIIVVCITRRRQRSRAPSHEYLNRMVSIDDAEKAKQKELEADIDWMGTLKSQTEIDHTNDTLTAPKGKLNSGNDNSITANIYSSVEVNGQSNGQSDEQANSTNKEDINRQDSNISNVSDDGGYINDGYLSPDNPDYGTLKSTSEISQSIETLTEIDPKPTDKTDIKITMLDSNDD